MKFAMEWYQSKLYGLTEGVMVVGWLFIALTKLIAGICKGTGLTLFGLRSRQAVRSHSWPDPSIVIQSREDKSLKCPLTQWSVLLQRERSCY